MPTKPKDGPCLDKSTNSRKERKDKSAETASGALSVLATSFSLLKSKVINCHSGFRNGSHTLKPRNSKSTTTKSAMNSMSFWSIRTKNSSSTLLSHSSETKLQRLLWICAYWMSRKSYITHHRTEFRIWMNLRKCCSLKFWCRMARKLRHLKLQYR